MKKRISWICSLFVVILAMGPLAPATRATAANGRQLLDNSKLAVAGILKVSKTSSGRLDPKIRKQAPFWKGMKEMSSTLRAIGQQVAAKDKKLASTLAKGSRTLAKVKTVWPRLGVKDAKVSGYLAKLDKSYTALRSAHGAEGARARRGGQLTAPERQRLEQIQRSQADFGRRLAPLQAQARRSHDRGTDAALTRLIAQSNRIATAQLAVDTLLTVAILLDDLHGEWDGYSYYVGDGCREGWGQLDTWVDTTYGGYDTLYGDTFDGYLAETWNHWEISVDIRVDVDYVVTDVAASEITSLDSFENISFEEPSWDAYSDEFVTAEVQQTVVEDAEGNLDLAVDYWEAEGLDITTADELADSDHQNVAVEADATTETVSDAAAEAVAEADEAEDAAAELDDAESEADDAESEADDAESEADDAESEADDTESEADDAAADEADTETDEPEAEEPAEEEEEESPPPARPINALVL